MSTRTKHPRIRVLIADDDENILKCYREAFSRPQKTSAMKRLSDLNAELFDDDAEDINSPIFDVIACSQGNDAVALAARASNDGHPFDVVILDVRMPPGINGVDAGTAIREMDPDVEIIFVTGYSDVSRGELERRVPPPMKLHYFNKPLSLAQLASDVADMLRSSQLGSAK